MRVTLVCKRSRTILLPAVFKNRNGPVIFGAKIFRNLASRTAAGSTVQLLERRGDVFLGGAFCPSSVQSAEDIKVLVATCVEKRVWHRAGASFNLNLQIWRCRTAAPTMGSDLLFFLPHHSIRHRALRSQPAKPAAAAPFPAATAPPPPSAIGPDNSLIEGPPRSAPSPGARHPPSRRRLTQPRRGQCSGPASRQMDGNRA